MTAPITTRGHKVEEENWSFLCLDPIDKLVSLGIGGGCFAQHATLYLKYIAPLTASLPKTYGDLAQAIETFLNDRENINLISQYQGTISASKQIYECLKNTYHCVGRFKILEETISAVIFVFQHDNGKSVFKFIKPKYRTGSALESEKNGCSLFHPNLLKTKHLFICDKEKLSLVKKDDLHLSGQVVLIGCITEYMEGVEDLCEKLNKQQRAFTEREAKKFMYELLQAIAYMHEQKCIHRDIKAENVLVSKDLKVKLLDFGSSKDIHEQKRATSIERGTRGCRPPEMIQTPNRGYTEKVDIWSAGLMFYECITYSFLPANQEGKVPIDNQLLFKMHISLDGQMLLKRMLEPNPQKRISAKETLRHPWFHSILN